MMRASHRTDPFTPAQVRRLRERAAQYAEQLVAEGRDPRLAQRDADQAYGLDNQPARREPAPDLPRELRLVLLDHAARSRVEIDGPKRPKDPALKSRERRARLKARAAAQEACA